MVLGVMEPLLAQEISRVLSEVMRMLGCAMLEDTMARMVPVCEAKNSTSLFDIIPYGLCNGIMASFDISSLTR
jgi:hypothetical protein